MKRNSNFIGRHLILDVQLNSLRNITQVHSIYNALESLSKTLDMTLVYPPLVAKFPWTATELDRFNQELKKEHLNSATVQKMDQLLSARKNEDAGISGVCVWLESHATIHTWIEASFFSFDAFSCKDFDFSKATTFLLNYFDIKSYQGLNITRSLKGKPKIQTLSY